MMNMMLENWQPIVASLTFVAVIVLLITEWVHLTTAALMGALLLVVVNIVSLPEAVEYIAKSHSTLTLFFGVMVLVRSLQPTKIFEYLGTQIVRWSQGRGDRLLLSIVVITTPICAVLPNATTVMLIAPLIPPIAEELAIDFVPLLILLVLVANSSGLLTIVGDPATFIVGSALNLSFWDYLVRLSFGGVLAIGVILALLPILWRTIWRTKLRDLETLPKVELEHPVALTFLLSIVATVVIFFVVGETLPIRMSPATVALSGAALSLLVVQKSRIAQVPDILKDIDWSTLIFFMSIFVLIGGLEKTGVIASLSTLLAIVLGKNIVLGSLILLFGVGAISSLVPNIPLVIAVVPLLKNYVVAAGLAGSEILTPGFGGQFPDVVLPLFYAMMYGATLGGNATIVGASSNLVAAGIAQQYGRPIAFRRYLKYGIPATAAQLIVLAFYVWLRFLR
ncbi:MAG: SLC13 family permease [Cyanobacteria bacterium]|nr:SLC13 family permease [Cyanobacteriota bacterium]